MAHVCVQMMDSRHMVRRGPDKSLQEARVELNMAAHEWNASYRGRSVRNAGHNGNEYLLIGAKGAFRGTIWIETDPIPAVEPWDNRRRAKAKR